MSVTVDIDANQNIRVTSEAIEARPPDRLDVAAEGVITMTPELLGAFEGASLKPARIDITVDQTRTIETDLQSEASLRLESVDVGIETPGVDDLSLTNEKSTDDPHSNAGPPGAIAFAVEGTIRGVPSDAVDSITAGSPTLESITFDVESQVVGDGGSPTDPVLRITLLRFGIVVHRNGTIDVGTRDGTMDLGLR
ncbi:hypothetical protein [Natronosalvus vescus]|uniref:hypothetical protein n=1 Tax=Natronosalvus vescus TaxID=2953881 RepID=UPI0020916FAF|nr:hypothetical protein [Natronosalvus vescus]